MLYHDALARPALSRDFQGKFTVMTDAENLQKCKHFVLSERPATVPPKGTAARRAPLGALSGEMSSRDNKTHFEAKFKQKRAICPFRSTNNDPS